MKVLSPFILLLITFCLVCEISAQHSRVVRVVDIASMGHSLLLMSSVVASSMATGDLNSNLLAGSGSLGRKRRATIWIGQPENNNLVSSDKSDIYEHSGRMTLNKNQEAGFYYRDVPIPLLPEFGNDKVKGVDLKHTKEPNYKSPAEGEIPTDATDIQTKGVEVLQTGMEGMGSMANVGANMGNAASDVAKSGQEMASGAESGMKMMSQGAEAASDVASKAGGLASSIGKK